MLIYRGKLNWEGYADNEEFTVLLPYGTSRLDDPIHLYWQWTKIDNGDTKVNVLCRTTITGVTQTAVEGESKFSCVHDDYYTFDITSKQNGAQLSIFMRNPAGYTSAEMILQKFSPSRVLSDSDFPMSPEKPVPRIYAGKLDWYTWAVNELFVVVLPNGLGKDYPVTAHWQWTVDSSGNKKVNCDADDQQRYADSNNQDANTFYFKQGGYYTLDCTADDNAQTLTVTMKNPAGSSPGSLTIQLQEIVDVSGDANSKRRKRAIVDHTAVIMNDTSDLVMCTFSPSATAAGGRVLAVGGFGLAATGFVPLIVTTLPTPYGWAIAVAGAGIAVLGLVDMALAAEDSSTRPLFPGDAASNRSSGGWFSSCNNISVIRVYIETVAGATQLVIKSGKAADVGDVTWRLSDSSSGLKWSDFFRITLPKAHHIKTYRGLKIKCLKPNWDGEEASSTDNSEPPDQYTLFTGAKNSGVRRYSTQVEEEEYDDVLFNCVSPDYWFTVTQGFGPNQKVSPWVGDYYITPLQNGIVVVQIFNCKMKGKMGSDGTWKVTTKDCNNENEVFDEISKNPAFFAYDWSPTDGKLFCWSQSQANQIVKDTARRTYFAVPGIDVKTLQFMFEDA